MSDEETLRRICARIEQSTRQLVGQASQAQWHCEDGWVVSYTTGRITGGPHDGRFLTQAFKPVGKGARGGRETAQEWVESYRREFATRKAAKRRAEALYARHSPRWAARADG